MSSFIMQSVAQLITQALENRGVRSLMYLDDLIIVSSRDQASEHYKQAIQLLELLGLQVAANKQVGHVRDWSLITGRGGLQNGKIAGPKLFAPPLKTG